MTSTTGRRMCQDPDSILDTFTTPDTTNRRAMRENRLVINFYGAMEQCYTNDYNGYI